MSSQPLVAAGGGNRSRVYKIVILALAVLLLSLIVALIAVAASSSAPKNTSECRSELDDISVTNAQPFFTYYVNLAIPQYNIDPPSWVVVPRHAEDVQRALACATRHNLPVAIKGGGHSYAGWSQATPNGFAIALNHFMSEITDVSDKWGVPAIRVGAGARLFDVYLFPERDRSAPRYDICWRILPNCGDCRFSSWRRARAFGSAVRSWHR